MSMPPLKAYRFKPPNWDGVCVPTRKQGRDYFYGWDNLTDFERQGIADIVQWIKENKGMDMPEDFHEREILKFIAGEWFKTDIGGEKLYQHLLWR